MLCTVGDLLTDVVVHLEDEPRRGTDTPARITMVRGGSAANVAVAAARSGVAVRFVGQVGDDDRGRGHIAELVDAGIDVRVPQHGTTGTTVALVDTSGERSFLTDRGAALELSVLEPDTLEGVTWLHVPGYSVIDGPLADTTQRLIGAARDLGVPISLSTSSVAALVEFGRAEFLEFVTVVGPEVVIANRDEARHLLREGLRFPKTTWSVVTNGPRATTAVHAGGDRRSIRPEPVDVIDSTGAGDAFTGALISALMADAGIEDAVRAGHTLAAHALRRPGAALDG